MPDHIVSTIDRSILRLALARPEEQNALTKDMASALSEALEQADENRHLQVVLLEAQGPVFCRGQAGEADAFATPYRRLIDTLSHMHKPLVAAIQGPALGAGLALLAGAHIVVAAQGASFGLTDIRDARFQPLTFNAVAKAVSRRRVLEWTLTGRIFSAQEALAGGLIHHVAPAFEFDDRALEIAENMAGFEPHALRAAIEA